MGRATYPKLPPNWCQVMYAPGVDASRPGIYQWTIEGVGTYIGKYTRITRPTAEYKRNVERLMAELEYRKGNRDGYRRIHRELRCAVRDKRPITLVILENPPAGELNRREQELIAQLRAEAGASGLPVLNCEPPRKRGRDKPRQAKEV